VRRALVAPVVAAAVAVGAVACGDDTADAPEDDPEAMRGQEIFQDNGCSSCHSTTGGSSQGPALDGIYGEDVDLDDGTTVTRDEDYLFRAIDEPMADIVDGYSGQMPTFGLDDDEIDALVAYIRSLG
jgi:cytochrome c oxidase subunit II